MSVRRGAARRCCRCSPGPRVGELHCPGDIGIIGERSYDQDIARLSTTAHFLSYCESPIGGEMGVRGHSTEQVPSCRGQEAPYS